MKRLKGVITSINEKGYGFITGEGAEIAIFFHSTQVKDVRFDDLREGDHVSYVYQESQKGPRAVIVRREG